MIGERPWGVLDPNSQHQIWSRWTFRVVEAGKHPNLEEVRANAARWLRKGFGACGRAKVEELARGWRIIAEVEGVPAHDGDYRRSVERQFARFVEQGWGPIAFGSVSVKMLAGDYQDGRPREQLVVARLAVH